MSITIQQYRFQVGLHAQKVYAKNANVEKSSLCRCHAKVSSKCSFFASLWCLQIFLHCAVQEALHIQEQIAQRIISQLLKKSNDIETNPGPPMQNYSQWRTVENRQILLGQTHQGSQIFPDSSRGRQCVPIALTFLSYALLKPNLNQWSQHVYPLH